ncbi:MAG: redoxin domain-containing protein [Acidobacteriota bacterium]
MKPLSTLRLLDASTWTLIDQAPMLETRPILFEFWATWCAPCVSAIPRIESLHDLQVGTTKLQILNITDEPLDDLRRFAQNHRLPSNVAVDSDGSVFRSFGVQARPHCVLLDADRRIVFEGHPGDISDQLITDVLGGKRLDEVAAKEAPSPAPALRTGLLEVSIRDSATGQFSASTTPDLIELHGHTVEQLLSYAFGVTALRLRSSDRVLMSRRLDVAVEVPDASAKAPALLARELPVALGMSIARVSEPTECLVLEKLSPDGVRLLRAPPEARAQLRLSEDGIHGVGYVETFLRYLEYSAGKPIVDRTGLSGAFQIDLTWKRGNLGSLQAALAAAGLRAELAVTSVELIRVSMP